MADRAILFGGELVRVFDNGDGTFSLAVSTTDQTDRAVLFGGELIRLVSNGDGTYSLGVTEVAAS